jgi:hypothetical protein
MVALFSVSGDALMAFGAMRDVSWDYVDEKKF